ncbi:MAG TPA: 3-oxoacyl-ACP reductase [Eubacteriaceae bacterium]|nr:3-oxoacyl-ACP reductase [Eubacteriaceae bacterium]
MKTAIVTGATSGIGLEMTHVLIKKGYKVYGMGRRFRQMPKEENFEAVICDFRDENALYGAAENIKKRESIDLLVNCAGVGFFGRHEEIDGGNLSDMIDVNLKSPILLTNFFMKDLKKNKGQIINVSSVTAKKISTYGCAYGATKAGLSSFFESLFEEVRKYGVRVTTIHPDITKTSFYDNANFEQGDTPDTYLNPQEISNVLDFILAQREGAVVTDLTMQPQKHRIRKK